MAYFNRGDMALIEIKEPEVKFVGVVVFVIPYNKAVSDVCSEGYIRRHLQKAFDNVIYQPKDFERLIVQTNDGIAICTSISDENIDIKKVTLEQLREMR